MSANIHDFTLEEYEEWVKTASSQSVEIAGQTMTLAEYSAHQWSFVSRPGQRFLAGNEMLTIYSSGRGWGKTRVGVEAIHEAAEDPEKWAGHAMIIAPEPGHIRDYCIEGQSGLLATKKPWQEIEHHPSKRRIRYRNPRGGGWGLTVRYASSYVPKQMRGPNVGLIWCDEFAFCQFPRDPNVEQDFFETARNAARAGSCRALITTTPLPIPQLIAYAKESVNPVCPRCGSTPHEMTEVDEDVRVFLEKSYRVVDPRFSTRTTAPEFTCNDCGEDYFSDVRWVQGSTMDNRAHLADDFINRRIRKQLNTRLGEQEVKGGLLLDNPGTVIKHAWVRQQWLALECDEDGWELKARQMLGLDKVVVWVDPAKTSGEKSDESGVVVVGINNTSGMLYVLEDLSVTAERARPLGAPSNTWAPIAWDAAIRWMAEVDVEDNVIGQLAGQQVHEAGEVVEGRRLAEKRELDWDRLGAADHALLSEEAMYNLSWRPKVHNVSQYKTKVLRWEWGSSRFRDDKVRLLCVIGRDVSYWSLFRASLCGFSREKKGPHKRDRGDAGLCGMRSCVGVDESAKGRRKTARVTSLRGAFGR